MRVLIAPNAFKGTLTAAQAAKLISQGILDADPAAKIDLMPISDGGDGLMEVLLGCLGGRKILRRVVGPIGKSLLAHFGLSRDGKTAIVEMAQASGIALLRRRELDALNATSFGTGQLIQAAIRSGARKIIVGLGGSATNDGGAGMAEALGVRFLDRNERPLPRGAAALADLHRIDADGMESVSGVSVIAVTDVRNPLVGPRGSAKVYGPQKGATPTMVMMIEKALKRYAAVIKRDLGADVSAIPGAGAAGGLGAGLITFLRARVESGAEWVLDALGAAKRMERADLVITGEGRADAQSFFGKAPVAVLRWARRRRVPAIYLCGQLDDRIRYKLRSAGADAVLCLAKPGEDAAMVMKESKKRLRESAREAMRRFSGRRGAAVLAAIIILLIVFVFGVGPMRVQAQGGAAADGGPYSQADDLYLHRNVGDNLDKSTSMLQAKLLTDSNDAEAMWRLGRNWVRVGERKNQRKEKLRYFSDAEKMIRHSIEINPKIADAHFWLGLAMGRTGQTRGILKSLFLVGPMKKEMKATLQLNPRFGGAYHVLGEMDRQIPSFAGGSKKGAVEKLEKAMAIDPNYTVNYTGLAQAYIDNGQKDKARAVLMKFYDVKKPEDPGEYDENKHDVEEMLKTLP